MGTSIPFLSLPLIGLNPQFDLTSRFLLLSSYRTLASSSLCFRSSPSGVSSYLRFIGLNADPFLFCRPAKYLICMLYIFILSRWFSSSINSHLFRSLSYFSMLTSDHKDAWITACFICVTVFIRISCLSSACRRRRNPCYSVPILRNKTGAPTRHVVSWFGIRIVN